MTAVMSNAIVVIEPYICIRFIKRSPRTERLHLVLFHHFVLNLGEVLGKHVLIENYWTLIYLSNKSFYPPSSFSRHHSDAGNKQKKGKKLFKLGFRQSQIQLIMFECPDFSFIFFLLIRSRCECALKQ